MPNANQIAAAIDLRVRQLEAQGITGIAFGQSYDQPHAGPAKQDREPVRRPLFCNSRDRLYVFRIDIENISSPPRIGSQTLEITSASLDSTSSQMDSNRPIFEAPVRSAIFARRFGPASPPLPGTPHLAIAAKVQ